MRRVGYLGLIGCFLIGAQCAGPTASDESHLSTPSAQSKIAPPLPSQTNSWQVFSSSRYGFSISYPPGFVVVSVANPMGVVPPGRLLEMRVYDSQFSAQNPPGEVEFGVYPKDADSLAAWVQKHTGPCSAMTSNTFYWDNTTNLVATKVAGEAALEFDWAHPCGDAPTLHETVLFLGSGYVFRINPWYSETTYKPTIDQIVAAMLATFKSTA